MSKTKASSKKHCGVVKYLEREHPKFAEVISDLCLEGIFNGRKGDGITFLLPNSGLMKEISDVAYEGDPEDAVSMITACVLYGYANDAGSFPSVTGNKAGVKMESSALKDGKVSFNGGKLTAVHNKDFEPFKGNKVSIWNIVDGKPITSGDSFNIRDAKTKQKVKKGGFVGDDLSASIRSSMLANIQQTLANKIYNKMNGKTVGGVDASQKSVTSIVNRIFLEAEKEKNLDAPFTKAFSAIASVWDTDANVMASMLLNPDHQLSSVLVPVYNKLHVTGGVDSDLSLNPSVEYSNYNNPDYMSGLLNKLGVKNNIAAASKLLNEKRRVIAGHYNKKEAVYNSDLLMSAYKDLYLSNKVVHGGTTVDNVLPASFLQSIQDTDSLNGSNNTVYHALGRDLMRHTLSLANEDVMTDVTPVSESIIQKELAGNFNDAKMYYGSSNAAENAKLFLDVKEIKNIGSRAGFDALRLSFLNSSDSLYLPSTVATSNESAHVYGGYYNRQQVHSDEVSSSNVSYFMAENYERLMKMHS